MKPPAVGVLLTSGDSDIKGVSDGLEIGQVIVENRLFEVIDAERLETVPLLNGRPGRGRKMRRVVSGARNLRTRRDVLKSLSGFMS